MMKKTITTLISGMLMLSANAHDRFANVEVKTTKLSDSVYILQGAGGNIGLSAGTDGVLMIDDQFEPIAPQIRDAIKAISDSDIRYLINTHYHGDHTGGNAWFKENEDVTIFAHDNVRIRLLGDQKIRPTGLPVVTYDQGVKFHFNGDVIHVRHVPQSHTDGDSYVYFEQQNIIHAGDMLFKNWFPYIDLDGGGSVSGYIETVRSMIAIVDDNTKIIAGHGGATANRDDLKNTLAMLIATAQEVKAMKDAGKTIEQAVDEGIDEKWADWSWYFITTEKWIRTLYNGQ